MWLEVICQLLIIAYVLWKYFTKPRNYPPGYWGLPLIGYIPFKRKTVTEHILELRGKHGNSPIISWRMGSKFVVFLFDNELIREAFTNKDFDARPKMRALGFLGGSNHGLVLGNGTPWQNTRRFTLHHLRNLGMGKSSLVPIIQNEAMELVKDLKSRAGKPTLLSKSVIVATLNVIWQMVARKRYTNEDEDLKIFLHLLEEFRSHMDHVTFVDFMPWLSSVTPSFIFKRILDEELLESFGTKIRDMLIRDIAEHENKLDIEDPKDYIDAYLIEMKKQEKDSTSTFSMEDLTAAVSDLFGAGSETTAITLQWTFLYLANHPEIQIRLQKEIDEVLPKGTLATLEDKPRLPYTEAVFHEVLRHSCFVKLGFMHMATIDTHLGGYKIPKGAIITPALFLANLDPKYWDSPNEFRPERFLDANGKFVQPKEGFYPFGIGKRQCLGESLARMELLIFVTTVLQNVNFATSPGKTLDMKPKPNTFVNYPKLDQELLITVR